MFEHKTFETILNEMLARVPNDIDKREGSVIYDALAPTAMELAETYSNMDLLLRLTFADTSSGDYLERRVGEHGVQRKKASKAIRRAIFTNSQDELFDVIEGSRFRLGDIVYEVKERIEQGEYRVEAQTAGEVGNRDYGELIPVEPIDGLGSAVLAEVLIPGEDDESDEALRTRFFEVINEIAYGGNVADYKQKINKINGVGGVKVFPIWQGGGTVKCTIIGSDFNIPTSELVAEIQTIIDPEVNQGKGVGLAPIGHIVTITGAVIHSIDIELGVITMSDMSLSQAQEEIEATLEEYFFSLRKLWKDNERLVVRVAQIDARILSIAGVVDVMNTKLNGFSENVTLEAEEIPLLGKVIFNE